MIEVLRVADPSPRASCLATSLKHQKHGPASKQATAWSPSTRSMPLRVVYRIPSLTREILVRWSTSLRRITQYIALYVSLYPYLSSNAFSPFLGHENGEKQSTNRKPRADRHMQKYIRQHFISILSSADPPAWSLEHDFHCFDAIRQQIMCHADDTLLYTTGHRDAGVNQTRQCRDWDALREWATERTACYFDYEAPIGETRWGKCDGGDDGLPRGSLLD